MPELPEVETITNALRPCLCGQQIKNIEIFSPAMRTPLTPLLNPELRGMEITEVYRRGRYTIIKLEKNFVLLLHYGMSGVVRMVEQDEKRRKHEHVSMNLAKGRALRFECTRRFSIFEVHQLEDGRRYPAVLDDLGLEPLSEEFTGEYLFKALTLRRGALKSAIMDNGIVVGIGNIYAAESLFEARLSPLRSANTLNLAECEKLVAAAKRILTEAIAVGGTTIHDYRQVDGSEGKFVNNLKIYGREGERCPVCGSIIEQCRIGGRSSCYCPGCQK